MVLASIAALAIAFMLLYTVAGIVRFIGGGPEITGLVQLLANFVFALALATNGIIGIVVAGAIVIMPVVFRVVALLWFRHISKKVMAGDYGDESKWAAEIANSGDSRFVEATNNLSKIEMREVGIESESKEELREMVVERGERNDES